jgi:CubicO group peptidase (beta-lactamase class C family)
MKLKWSLTLAILALAIGAATLTTAQPPPPDLLPVTGKGVEVLKPLDAAMEKVMLRHGIPGGSLAVTRNGKLVLAKGYGWVNYDTNATAGPDTLFGTASVSKCFTAAAILKLVDDKQLSLEDKAFEILKDLKPPPGAGVNPILYTITIRQLLNHSGGWNRAVSGDPINWARQVAQRLQVRMPINADHLIRFMLAVPLDFRPGTGVQYSNFGYVVLGQVVAKVSGQSYEEYVQKKVLAPMGIRKARLHGDEGRYFPGESLRYMAGTDKVLPAYNLPWTEACGGWVVSSVDLARFMTAMEGSRGKAFLSEAIAKEMLAPPPPPLRPNPDGSYFGLGWDVVQPLPKGIYYLKRGCYHGTRASVKHRVDGINTIVMFNANVDPDPLDMRIVNDAATEVHEAANKIMQWPDVDLFKDYP